MLNINNLYQYQKNICNFICSHRKSAIWCGCGLGKTISVLTSINFLLRKGKISKALIVAPPNVTENVWKQESQLWEHTKDLRISLVIGTEKQRIKALEEDADIYCISRDLLHWLFKHEEYKFDFLCIDEASGFKDKKSRRYASLMQKTINTAGKKYHRKNPMIAMFKNGFVCELTGTPASESLSGLWSQIQILSYGTVNPLGKSLTEFRERYMIPQMFNGFPVYNKMRNGADKDIQDKLDEAGMCISMRTEDYIELPEKIEVIRYITMKDKRYAEMKKNSVVNVDNVDIVANSALDKINKAQQICSGFLYDDTGTAHILNHDKEEALNEILEGLDEPVLILYKYEYEKEMLKKLGGVPLDNEKAIKRWNEGKIKIGLLYPSNAYGLNIQSKCSVIIWYSQSLSGEQTEQAIKRIWRQGQKKKVRIFYLIFRNTVDEMVYNLIREKKNVLDELLIHFSI